MLPLLTASLILHVAAFAIYRARQQRQRRRPSLPVIGRDPLLTDALHKRLSSSGHALVQVTLGIAFMILFALVILSTLTDGPN